MTPKGLLDGVGRPAGDNLADCLQESVTDTENVVGLSFGVQLQNDFFTAFLDSLARARPRGLEAKFGKRLSQ